MRVAVYDSGVGGLSILQALMQSLPDLEYLFVSDNAAYPCLLYTSPSPRDRQKSRMPSSA